jgi:hypothetical protein
MIGGSAQWIAENDPWQTTVLMPTVGDQATLNLAIGSARAAIQGTRSKDMSVLNANQLQEQITLEVVDSNPTGAFVPEDQVTVTSPTSGLSDVYTVKRIERDMTDPNYAKLDLTTRHIEYWELNENTRRLVKTLATQVAP